MQSSYGEYTCEGVIIMTVDAVVDVDAPAQAGEPRWWPAIGVLSVCWALAFSVLTACAAAINLAAASLSASPGLRTLPLALISFTSAAYNVALPAAFARLGRLGAYIVGAAIGVAGGLVCLLACERASVGALCVGAVLIGVGECHAQNYRFGVLLCVPEAAHPIAISWVLAGGVVGAVLGPEYAKHALQLGGLKPFSGIFLVCAAMFAANFGLLIGGRRALRGLSRPRHTPQAPAAARRSLVAIFARPRAAAATAIAAIAYGVMVFLMAALPLAMAESGMGFSDSSLAVQLHMVAMFAPSFVTGHAVKRLGAPPLEGLGAILLAAGGVVAHVARGRHRGGVPVFAASQCAIGLGWNLCFVAATATLAAQTRPLERARAQAVNDAAVFTTSGVLGLLAAPALADIGWRAMQVTAFVAGAAILLVTSVSELLERARPVDLQKSGAASTLSSSS
jgi:hypothetical protein